MKSKYKLESNGKVSISGEDIFEVTICQEKEGLEDDNVSLAGSDHKSTSSFLAKTNSNEPRELALDMFLSSIDLSFFTLPLVF